MWTSACPTAGCRGWSAAPASASAPAGPAAAPFVSEIAEIFETGEKISEKKNNLFEIEELFLFWVSLKPVLEMLDWEVSALIWSIPST